MWLQIPAWVTLSKSRDLWGSNCLSIKWGTIKESVWQFPSPPELRILPCIMKTCLPKFLGGK